MNTVWVVPRRAIGGVLVACLLTVAGSAFLDHQAQQWTEHLRAEAQALATAAPVAEDGPGLLQAIPAAGDAHPAEPGGPTDPEELKQFLAQTFAKQMAALHVPGAVFAMVKDGRVFFSSGYGYADEEKRTPVLPDRTLFRVGSVSKLFVATAVMQLAERGKLDLKTDVNRYLKALKLKNTYPQPVTMANLLTHTGGFDEQILGMAARREEDQPPLGKYLARRMPDRVMPPGQVISYSNHGSALAGHIVEEIAGVPFDEYVDKNIFVPLQMRHSSFRLPPALSGDIATGYDWDFQKQQYQPVPFDFLNVAPAGALNSSALDMTHFMIAHLQDGRYGNVRILEEATAREMHRQQFTHHPKLSGFAYGFYERLQNGHRSLEHGGLWRGFASELFLLPDQKLGFFISCNRGEARFPEFVVHAFVNRYYPVARTRVGVSSEVRRMSLSAEDLSRFVGSYRFNRYDRHTLCKLAVVFSDIRITAAKDAGGGVLIVHFPFAGETRWTPVGPLLFRMEGSGQLMAFLTDKDGRITHACLGMAACEKLAPWETLRFQGRLFTVLIAIFLGMVVIGAGRLIRAPAAVPEAATVRALAAAASAGNLFFIFALPSAMLNAGFEMAYGAPPRVVALLFIPLLTTALNLMAILLGVRGWKRAGWSVAGGIHLGALAASTVVFTWVLQYWNLLGFRL